MVSTTTHDASISANELVRHLHSHYLDTLLINAASADKPRLPGCTSFDVLASLQNPWQQELDAFSRLMASIAVKPMDEPTKESMDGFAQPNIDLNLDLQRLKPIGSPMDASAIIARERNSVLNRRIGCWVVIIDDDGVPSGKAAYLQHLFATEGLCTAAFYLQGGIDSLVVSHPLLLSATPIPELRHETEIQSLGSLHRHNSVAALRLHQEQLVQAVWYQHSQRDTPHPIIPDFLFLSSCYGATEDALVANNIRYVLRLGSFWTNYEAYNSDKPDDAKITLYQVDIADSPLEDISVHFDWIYDEIEAIRNKGERILIHCHAGVSRSSTIVLMYLMRFYKISLYDAWNTTYVARPIVRPNIGFARALQDLEKSLFNVKNPSLSVFWMSESYNFYLDYVEWKYRCIACQSLL